MQRYFVAKEQMGDQEVKITGEDVKHISRVMRMNIGDQIICSDNDSRTVSCRISSMMDQEIIADIIESLAPNTELPVEVTIAQGLPKGDKLDLIIQKGTELGAHTFIPYSASRSVVKWDHKKAGKKVERLEKIAKEAAEQSYRERIPVVLTVQTLAELKKQMSQYDSVILAYEESAKEGEKSQFASALSELKVGQKIMIIVGPEGGLTDEEVRQLCSEGAVASGFGPRILRTETAALYALSAISYHFELMR
ncbi:16S rRNA (uracil(1498)-N(3))-methyltransferase [Halalkalibacter akibai]|uniref:Ribosomal RNA small subunit methyltransferase E n=1 Tax=Halalkalibacter akibai (strain ATCC 43226 / DSM 21942 / CIP 109018 / JCM 9157 / 1139) TaxID=1236973 RepID=W4QNW6_HALA3|nr:16S rRNA (uracil(1498)-N(3))-methyltransferase [Halalkalibacter akibai]GAE33358.1 ribosomal RNA small subunit methyltransferase E [Halalkalibacter akibai JCM 9157]